MLRMAVLWFVGLAAGAAVAAGLFAFLAITGVVHRLMAESHTSVFGNWYEWMVIAGCAAGNVCWLWEPSWQLGAAGQPAAAAAGLFVGIFVGCLIGAIAEVLNVFPVFLRRAGIRRGMMFIVLSLAVGKAVGAVLWYFAG